MKQLIKFQTTRGLDKQDYNWENEAMNVIEEILEEKGYDIPKAVRSDFLMPIVQYMRTKAATNPAIRWHRPSDHDRVDAACDQIVFNVGKIMKLGYHPEIAISEVGKEINSRDGIIINGKFEKYLDDASISKHYKANFTKAKV